MYKKIAFFFCFLMSLGAHAKAEEYSKWFTELKGEDVLYAATTSDSGAVFGQFCYLDEGGSCVYLIGMSTSCNKGDQYPVLANSDSGASSLKVLCDGQLKDGTFRYVFADFDMVDGIIKNGTRIGFAVPLQSDQFKVFRFSLEGAKPAIAVMRSIAEKKATQEPGSQDQTL